MSENLIPAQSEGQPAFDFWTPVLNMVEDAAATGNGNVCNDLVQCLGGGIAMIAGLFETQEQSDEFMERFKVACSNDAKTRYPELAEARSIYGTLSLTAPADLH